MSTQRYISTSFWDDEWIQTLDPSEKLLYLYYMTSPLTNIAGVYKLSVRRICFDTGFNSDTIGHIMAKFEKAKKAYRIGEYVALPSWPKHQKWEKSDKIKTGIEACLKELPKEVKDRLKEIGYQYPMDTGYIPPAYSSSYSDSDSDLDIDSDKELPSLPTEALSFSRLLYTLHKDQIDAKAKKPTESAAREWANSIDMLHRLDGRDWPDIEKAIRWIKTPGNFWAPNIMSGQTLRRQFDKVWAQMAQRPKEDSHQDHVRSFVERIEAEEKSKRESGILG